MRKRRTISYLLTVCLVLSAFFLVSCTEIDPPETLSDVLTLKATENGRHVVTMTAIEGIDLTAFESAVETKFPDVDLVIVGSFTDDYDTEIAKRLARNDLTDLVCFRNPDSGAEYRSARLVDLSGLSLSARYTQSSLDELRDNGRVYMVPLPKRIRCIVYNKTYFEENGLAAPTDFDSFLRLQESIAAAGTRGLRLPLSNAEILRNAFTAFGYQPCFAKSAAESEAWRTAYNARAEGASFDKMRPAFDNFLALIRAGAIGTEGDADDFGYREDARAADLLERRSVMTVGSPGLLEELETARGDSEDEFDLMPFYSGGEGSGWLDVRAPAYYGLNRQLTEDRAQYDRALKVLDYMSTAEGQSVLIESGNGQFSNLAGARGADVRADAFGGISEAIRESRFARTEAFRQTAEEGLSAALSKLFRGSAVSAEGVLKADGTALSSDDAFSALVKEVDAANRRTEPETGRSLGTVAEDFSLSETGAFIADAMRIAADSEIALIPDAGKDGADLGRGVAAKFYYGALTERDLDRALPGLADGAGGLSIVLMRGADLLEALEYGLTGLGGADGFYYFSGLRADFNPLAPKGSRVGNVTEENGTPISAQYAYTVAILSGTVDPKYYAGSEEDTGKTVAEVVRQAVVRRRTLSPARDDRLRIGL